MQVNRRVVAIGAAVAAVAAGGVGIAYAVGGGESEEAVTGPDAEKAITAALEQVGGGEVLEAEYQEAGGAGVYEVEVQRPDGSQVEVLVSGDFNAVGTPADDDLGAEGQAPKTRARATTTDHRPRCAHLTSWAARARRIPGTDPAVTVRGGLEAARLIMRRTAPAGAVHASGARLRLSRRDRSCFKPYPMQPLAKPPVVPAAQKAT